MFKKIRRVNSPLKKVTPKILEKDIERGILHYLSTLSHIKVWKQNSIGVFDAKTGRYRLPHSPYIIRGVSDVIGIINYGLCNGQNCGRFLAVEIKTPKRKGNVSDDQKQFIKMITSNGGLAFVATSIDDVKEVFKREGIST
jgi:hypothetical protein